MILRFVRLAAFPTILLAACSSPPSTPVLEWEPVDAGLTTSLRGLSLASDRVAWVSGSEGSYSITRDGGVSWTPGSLPGTESLDFRDVEAFPDGSAFLMSAGAGPASRIYKTTDWGRTWALQHENGHESGFFNGMAFWNPEAGAVVGDPIDGTLFLLTTEDGGESWTRLQHSGMPTFLEGEYGFAASGTNIAVTGDSTLAVVSGGPVARVFITRDRGATWRVVEAPMAAGNASSGIFSIGFRSQDRILLAGGDYQSPNATAGTLAHSSDGGNTWLSSEGDSTVGFRSGIAYMDDPVNPIWVAVGTPGSSFSLDDGNRWITFDSTALNAVGFFGPTGLAAGPEGMVARLRVR